MKKHIELNKKQIEYTLKRNRRSRRLRLSVYCDGRFVVSAPRFVSQNFVESFIISKTDWIIERLENFSKLGYKSRKSERGDYLRLKSQAFNFAKSRVEYFNQFYQFSYNKISIKNQKTVWGSCSKKGNLNFNYKIVRLPQAIADYLVVHELCHLFEFNHSSEFWKLVAQAIPDYRILKKELKQLALRE